MGTIQQQKYKKHRYSVVNKFLIYISVFSFIFQPIILSASPSIIVDQSVKEKAPQLDNAPNGVPVINIVKPNNEGLSHNQFEKYNVNEQGIILNNSGAISNTQLGAYISGNPNLANGSHAQLILNEVTGLNRSELKGYSEVAGNAADLIIANPNGITCNGCGFINTPRAMLTTGKSQVTNEGNLDFIAIHNGDINIAGKGLDASQTDFFSILARAANIQASIHANELNIVSGKNNIDPRSHELLSSDTKSEQSSPNIAIDSSVLGGMYAKKIYILATEKGVGVNTQGDIISEGKLELSSNGDLSTNQVIAGSDLILKAQNKLETNGSTYGNNVAITTDGNVVNKKLLASASNIKISAKEFINDGEVIAGITRNGNVAANGELEVNTQQVVNNVGALTAVSNMTIKTNTLLNQEKASINSGKKISVNAIDVINSGDVVANDEISLDIKNNLDNTAASIQGKSANIKANSINNKNGKVIVNKELAITSTSAFNNTKGVISSGDDNSNIKLDIASSLTNSLGQIYANGSLDINAQSLKNTQGQIIATDNLILQTEDESDNSEGKIQAKSIDITTQNKLTNNSGTITSENKLAIVSNQGINNINGIINSTNSSTIIKTSGTLDTQKGVLQAGENLHISSGAINNNEGIFLADDQLILTSAGSLSNIKGAIVGSELNINVTGNLNNEQAVINGLKSINHKIEVTDTLDNTQGQIQTLGSVNLTAAELNNSQGKIITNNKLDLSAKGKLENTNGIIHAAQQFISAASINNSSGTISSTTQQNITSANELNNFAGKIINDGAQAQNINVQQDINNEQGAIVSKGDTVIQADAVNNNQGVMLVQNKLQLDSNGLLSNQQGNIKTQYLQLDAGAIENTAGLIAVNDQMQLNSQGAIKNIKGVIQAAGDGQHSITSSANLNNKTGVIKTNGDLSIVAENLDNTEGVLQATKKMDGTIKQTTINNAGQINAGGLVLKSTSVSNKTGSITSGKTLEITTNDSVDNSAGSIVSNGSIVINSGGQITNTLATLISNDKIAISSREIDNEQGAIQSFSDLMINTGNLNNQQGSIYGGNIRLKTENLNNQDASLQASSLIDINAKSIDNTRANILAAGDQKNSIVLSESLNNQQGNLASNGDWIVHAKAINNNSGNIQAQKQLDIKAQALDNSKGKIVSNKNIEIDVSEINNESGEIISVSQTKITTNHFNFEKNDSVNAGETLSITAQNLNVADSSEWNILGNVQIEIEETITNKGNMNANNITLSALQLNNDGILTSTHDAAIDAQSIKNNNTIGAGNNLVVQASDTFTNDKGLVFSAQDMSLLLSKLVNEQGDIIAGKRLALAKNVQGEKALLLLNKSGNIESAQDMLLAVEQLSNIEELPDVSLGNTQRIKGEVIRLTYGGPRGRAIPKDPDGYRLTLEKHPVLFPIFEKYASETSWYNYWNQDSGNRVKRFVINVTRQEEQADLDAIDSARISSGNNLIINANNIENQVSSISAQGDVTIDAGQLTNTGLALHKKEKGTWELGTKKKDDSKRYGGPRGAIDDTTVSSQVPSTIEAGGTLQLNVANINNKNSNFQEFSGYAQSNSDIPDSQQNTQNIEPINTIENDDVENIKIDQNKKIEVAKIIDGETQNQTIELADVDKQKVNTTNDVESIKPPELALPNLSALFQSTKDTNANYLIETNPAFANYANFISSDYMFEKLGIDPEQNQKRLGDGYFEQRLVRDAITAKLGRQFINPTLSSDYEQYKYLLDNAIIAQAALELAPGVSLSASQINALNTDIVWMEERTVNGQVVLAPVVYLSNKTLNNKLQGASLTANKLAIENNSNINNQGNILSKTSLSIDSTGNINNSFGQIEGQQLVSISSLADVNNNSGIIRGYDVKIDADNINNITALKTVNMQSGAHKLKRDFVQQTAQIQSAGELSLNARESIQNLGADLKSAQNLSLTAGKDIKIGTVVASENNTKRSAKQRIDVRETHHTASELGAGGNIVAQAQNTLVLEGSNVTSDANIKLTAQDVTVAAAKDSAYLDSFRKSKGSKHWQTIEREKLVGGNIQAKGDIAIQANTQTAQSDAGNIRLRAVDIQAGVDRDGNTQKEAGHLALQADSNINIEHENIKEYSYSRLKKKGGSFISKKQTDKIHMRDENKVIGSSLSANSVELMAGAGGQGDLNVSASQIIAEKNLKATAAGDINVSSAEQSISTLHIKKTKKSGLLGSGGIGFTRGTMKQSRDQTQKITEQVGSHLASLNGDIDIRAGENYQQEASSLNALTGDVNVHAKRIDVVSANNVVQETDKSKFSKSGISVGLSGALKTLENQIQSTRNTGEKGQTTGNQRKDQFVQGMRGLSTLQSAGDVADGVSNAANILKNGGSILNPQSTVGNVNMGIHVTLGAEKSTSDRRYNSSTAQAASILAGGDINLKATGAGKDSDIVVAGSRLQADNNITIQADDNVDLKAVANTTKLRANNKNQSGSIGVNIGVGDQTGIAITAGLSLGKGHTDADSTQWQETLIEAANKVAINSGADTNIKGAQVIADHVSVNSKGDLNIQSLQDTAEFESEQKQAGANISVCVPPLCVGTPVKGGASYSASDIENEYTSVQEQSGIFAGKQGFDIDVANHTQLDAAVIASTADASKNTLDTQSFSHTNLHNKEESSASSSSYSASFSYDGDQERQHPSRDDNANNGQGGALSSNTKPQKSAFDQGNLLSDNLGNLLTKDIIDEQQASTTYSAISPAQITVRDDQSTGKDSVADLSRDADAVKNALSRQFDEQDAREQVDIANFNRQVIEETTQLGMREVGDYLKSKTDPLQLEKQQLRKPQSNGTLNQQDQQRIAAIDAQLEELEQQRKVLHAGVSAIAAALGDGNVVAAAGGAVAGAQLAELAHKALQDNDTLDGQQKELLVNIAANAGGVIGGVAAGDAGAGAVAASIGDAYNRQLHPDTHALIADLAKDLASDKYKNSGYTEQELANYLVLLGEGLTDNLGSIKLQNYIGELTQLVEQAPEYKNVWTERQKAAQRELAGFDLVIDDFKSLYTHYKDKPILNAQGNIATTPTKGNYLWGEREPVKYFGSTPDQYRASGVYAFTKADIASENRIAAQQQMLFDQNNAVNGSAAPTTIVEDTLSLIPVAGAVKLATWGIGKVGGKLGLGKADDVLSHAADDALSKTKNDKLLGSAEQGVVNSGKADAPAGTMHGGDGAKNGISVLGKYPDYIKLSNELGAKRFSIPTDVWNKMSKTEQWGANKKFLDRMIKRGDDIVLSNPVKDVKDVSGAFRKELDYLMEQGLKLSDDGARLIK